MYVCMYLSCVRILHMYAYMKPLFLRKTIWKRTFTAAWHCARDIPQQGYVVLLEVTAHVDTTTRPLLWTQRSTPTATREAKKIDTSFDKWRRPKFSSYGVVKEYTITLYSLRYTGYYIHVRMSVLLRPVCVLTKSMGLGVLHIWTFILFVYPSASI